jgi:3-oxo-5alpha-steroid 4-dehydrogenase
VHACRDLLKKIEGSGKKVRVRAKGGVILAMGGFIFDTGETKTHIPQCEKTLRLGTIADDGRALTLGKKVGAGLRKMDRSAIWIFFNPPRAFLHGALIDRQGKRICNEELYGATVAMHMVESHNRKGVLVIDHKIWQKIRQQMKTTKGAHFQVLTGFINLFSNRAKANSLRELERHCAMPEGSLQQAVKKYNEGVDAGEDEKGKNASLLEKIAHPPFYAINCDIGEARFMMPSMSLGGLAVDGLTAQVLKENGEPINGLYAAGRSAAGISSHSYVTGLSIADGIFAGRNAGKSTALAAKGGQDVPVDLAGERSVA